MTTTRSETAPGERGDRRLIIETPQATRTIPLTRGRLMAGSALAAIGLGWIVMSSAGFIVSHLGDNQVVADSAMIEAAYERRIDALEQALSESRVVGETTVERLDKALAELVEKQRDLNAALVVSSDVSQDLAALRTQLADLVEERDAAETRAQALGAELAQLESRDRTGAEQAQELDVVLDAVADALASAVRDRDTQRADLSRMQSEIATLELKAEINADRQERLVASLEEAVETSFRPLEEMFENSGLSVDTLISGVRQNYTGVGGPHGGVPAANPGLADPALNSRFAALITDMERMDMMRIAATKVPYAMPVRQAHRFTSGFGTRRDPKTGGRRAHNGIDLAGPRGTPIEATADGVVVFAGRQGGFGNVVRIRHAYGFETLYAHLNKIHVNVGDRIARRDHIGDMGTTGRSTGVHLHYEVRVGGRPVNPMTYIRAAQDVF